MYAMPWIIAAPFVLLCLWLYTRKQRAELAMMLVSLLLAFACVEAYVRMDADNIFYREHEKWALKGRYRADVHDKIHVRHGDLVAMDPSLLNALAEPHDMEFITDSAGFRNAQDYAGEPYVVLGDSFAASTGTTQADTLTAQLNAAQPKTFYSRGFPGAPKDYEANAWLFVHSTPSDARFVWFVFEGNDFNFPEEQTAPPHLPTAKDWWSDNFSTRSLPFLATRFFTLLQKSAQTHMNAAKEMPSPVAIYKIAGIPVGFYKPYIDAATEKKLDLRMLGTPEIMSRTACIFFIPDKYRVYKQYGLAKAPICRNRRRDW